MKSTLLISLVFLAILQINAQEINSSYYCKDTIRNYHIFDSIRVSNSVGFKNHKSNFYRSQKISVDESVSWYERSYGYWNAFQAAGYLLLEDKTMKELWNKGFNHDPTLMCHFLEDRVNPAKQSHNWHKYDRLFMPYLLRESSYYGCMCNEYYNGHSKTIQNELAVILERDQSKNRDHLGKTQMKIDQENLARVEKIISELGSYPGRSIVGRELQDVAWLVLQHSNLETLLKYRELIRKACFDDRELLPSYWAYTEDRISIWQGKPQKYGTQYYIKKDKHILNELENRKKVDVYRKSLFMKPLHKYRSSNNIKYFEREGRVLKF